MANKKTTLKTQTGDNVYPNVLKENLPASTIFYGDEAAGPEGEVETPSGGTAAEEFETVVISDDGKTYTGTITGTKPLIAKQNVYGVQNVIYTL